MDAVSDPYGFKFWFWCIPEAERNILRLCCASLFTTVGTHVPNPVWLAAWAFVAESRDGRRSAFVDIYGLQVLEIPVPETEALETVVAVRDIAFWVFLLERFTAGEMNGFQSCGRWYPA